MLDELRERMRAYLGGHCVAVVSTAGSAGAWAMPARYRASGLEVDLLLPRWADVAFHLERDPHVLLVVQCGNGNGLRWLEYHGIARSSAEPDWTGLVPVDTPLARAPWLYHLVHVAPTRIDLIDEGQGWGARETLDC